MPVERDTMTIAELLTTPEGKTLDFKRDLSSSKGVVKDLIAFANTAGGTLVFGVDDKTRELVGLEKPLDAEEKLANLIVDLIEPMLYPNIELTTVDGKDLLIVRVPFWPAPFHRKDEGPENGVYIRIGSTSRKAGPEFVAEIQRQKSNVAFDQEPCTSVQRAGLDDARIQASLAPIGMATDAKLRGLGVLTDYAGTSVASNGGVILFGRDEVRQQQFPDARVRCIAFDGETKAASIGDQLDRRDITILEAVDAVDRFIDINTRNPAEDAGMRRREIAPYSPKMIREILINALGHSDYSLKGQTIRVAVYSNRLEIESPGMLPFGMTIEQFKAGESKIRNRVLAEVFNKLDLLEGWGRAWARIQEEIALGYPEPDFDEQGPYFKVTIYPHAEAGLARTAGGGRARPQVVGLPRSQEIAYQFLQKAGGPVRFSDVRDQVKAEISISDRGVQEALKALRNKGLVTSAGRGGGATWSLAE